MSLALLIAAAWFLGWKLTDACRDALRDRQSSLCHWNLGSDAKSPTRTTEQNLSLSTGRFLRQRRYMGAARAIHGPARCSNSVAP